jgi:hypothetical protein
MGLETCATRVRQSPRHDATQAPAGRATPREDAEAWRPSSVRAPRAESEGARAAASAQQARACVSGEAGRLWSLEPAGQQSVETQLAHAIAGWTMLSRHATTIIEAMSRRITNVTSGPVHGVTRGA